MNAILLAACVSVVMPVIDNASPPTPLKGLKGFRVSVRIMEIQALKLDLDDELVVATATLRLHGNGIRVMDDNDWLDDPSRPLLSIKVRVFKKGDVVLTVFDIDVRQMAKLVSGPEMMVTISSRQHSILASTGGNAKADFLEALEHGIDNFSKDYMWANRKHPVEKKEESKP